VLHITFQEKRQILDVRLSGSSTASSSLSSGKTSGGMSEWQ